MSDKQQEITGWAMYDWANSAFSATVVTVLLGPYLAALISKESGEVLVVALALLFCSSPICVRPSGMRVTKYRR